jgi:hypothetical protein
MKRLRHQPPQKSLNPLSTKSVKRQNLKNNSLHICARDHKTLSFKIVNYCRKRKLPGLRSDLSPYVALALHVPCVNHERQRSSMRPDDGK